MWPARLGSAVAGRAQRQARHQASAAPRRGASQEQPRALWGTRDRTGAARERGAGWNKRLSRLRPDQNSNNTGLGRGWRAAPCPIQLPGPRGTAGAAAGAHFSGRNRRGRQCGWQPGLQRSERKGSLTHTGPTRSESLSPAPAAEAHRWRGGRPHAQPKASAGAGAPAAPSEAKRSRPGKRAARHSRGVRFSGAKAVFGNV